MRPVLLAFLAVFAFAANSLTARAALAGDANDPFAFALVRVLTGALFLAAFLRTRPTWRDAPGSVALSVYMFGFAAAYTAMSTATGALVLFSAVQLTVLALSAVSGERVTRIGVLGCGIAFGGLVILLLADAENASLIAIGSMLMAGMAWGVYTVLGRKSEAPVQQTARQFALASLISLPAVFAVQSSNLSASLTLHGAALAAISGVIFSGLGYALWYAVSPRLPAASVASVQLLTPVVAAGMGAALLSEPITARLVLATLVILGGVGLTLVKRPAT